jgi:hypothetical protein
MDVRIVVCFAPAMAIEVRADIDEVDLIRSNVFIDLFHGSLRYVVELEDEFVELLP